MAKCFVKIGFESRSETSPGVWTGITEREYFGDLTRNHNRWASTQNVNGELTLQNEISIVADPYAIQNFQSIRYVDFNNSYWVVTSVDVQYPRLILSVGGVYNGEKATTT